MVCQYWSSMIFSFLNGIGLFSKSASVDFSECLFFFFKSEEIKLQGDDDPLHF
jgi:hypothetical protein